MLCTLAARLQEEKVAEIEALERKLGVALLAYSCHQAEPAELSDAQVGEIRELEEELAIPLVALKPWAVV